MQGLRLTPVVQLGDAAISLLACSIPYLEAHNRGGVDVDDLFGQEGGAYGGSGIGEGVLHVSVDEAGFADSLARVSMSAMKPVCGREMKDTWEPSTTTFASTSEPAIFGRVHGASEELVV